MAVYKPYGKRASGKEEIKIAYDVLADPPTIPAEVTENTVSGWGFTKNTGTVTSVAVKMNGAEKGKVTSSGTIDLGTVLTNASAFATSAQGTKADNAMPKAGGAFTGAVTVQAPTAEMNPATKQYVDTVINAVKQFEYQVVTELPTAAQATMGKIYLVAHSHNPSDGKPDSYDEFITVQSGSTYKWERIGNTDIDLSGYVPTTRKINNKVLSSDINLGASDVGVTETAFPGLNKTGTVTAVKMNDTTKNPASGVVDLGTVITAHQDISGKQDKITSTAKLPASLVSGLATVATSGSYNDLSNKPTIPTVYDDTLTIKRNGTTVQIFSANQSGNVTADIIFHLYEHNIYLSCSNTTSTVAPSRAYIYFTIITTDSRALNWTRLNNILRTAERNAGGYGYIGDLEGNNKSFNASVQKIQSSNTNSIYVTMVYNNSLLGIDNTYDSVTFYSNYVTITDTVRTIL